METRNLRYLAAGKDRGTFFGTDIFTSIANFERAIPKDIDVNAACDEMGNTLLHLAIIENKSIEHAIVLIHRGADINKLNKSNDSPKDLAYTIGLDFATQFIIEYRNFISYLRLKAILLHSKSLAEFKQEKIRFQRFLSNVIESSPQATLYLWTGYSKVKYKMNEKIIIQKSTADEKHVCTKPFIDEKNKLITQIKQLNEKFEAYVKSWHREVKASEGQALSDELNRWNAEVTRFKKSIPLALKSNPDIDDAIISINEIEKSILNNYYRADSIIRNKQWAILTAENASLRKSLSEKDQLMSAPCGMFAGSKKPETVAVADVKGVGLTR